MDQPIWLLVNGCRIECEQKIERGACLRHQLHDSRSQWPSMLSLAAIACHYPDTRCICVRHNQHLPVSPPNVNWSHIHVDHSAASAASASAVTSSLACATTFLIALAYISISLGTSCLNLHKPLQMRQSQSGLPLCYAAKWHAPWHRENSIVDCLRVRQGAFQQAATGVE